MQVARGCLTINNLFFVNDTNPKYPKYLEKIYGQGINKLKTGIFFNFNTSLVVATQILALAGVFLCSSHEKYLDLSTILSKNKY